MGKRIISQRRGRGTHTYKVRRKAFRFKPQYPKNLKGEGIVVKLFDSAAHSSPLAKVTYSEGSFLMHAFKGMFEGQKITFGGEKGGIRNVGTIPLKTKVFNIESRPGDGGKFMKSGGNSAMIHKIVGDDVFVLFPSKKTKKLNKNCRATIGVAAGAGRLDKPIVKAGKQFHIKKSKSKLWPRTSAVKMNAIDHPFGSGRGKNPKSKIAKRNAPPGRRVGLVRPRRTGKRK
ncbi:MAG: 50S ribosomal protein L2 [Nanoarchaeota archaeon]